MSTLVGQSPLFVMRVLHGWMPSRGCDHMQKPGGGRVRASHGVVIPIRGSLSLCVDGLVAASQADLANMGINRRWRPWLCHGHDDMARVTGGMA